MRIFRRLAVPLLLAAVAVPAASEQSNFRYRPDAQRGRVWLLTHEGVFLQQAGKAGRVAISLPEWHWVGEPYACMPDLTLGPRGEAIITSNIVPKVWRIDPQSLLVTAHDLTLDADTGKDVGFSGILYSPKHDAYLAVSELQRSFWRIDTRLERASKTSAAQLPPAQRSALARTAFCGHGNLYLGEIP